jgi:hypothetical protein
MQCAGGATFPQELAMISLRSVFIVSTLVVVGCAAASVSDDVGCSARSVTRISD